MEHTFTENLKEVRNNKIEEGPVAMSIEKQTAKIPSDAFLWAAVGAMAGSITLGIAGRKHAALFMGQWAAPLLLFGLYNKIVKVAGHDQNHPASINSNTSGHEPAGL